MLSLHAVSFEPDYDYKKADKDLQISVVGKTDPEKQRGKGLDKRKSFYSPVCDWNRCVASECEDLPDELPPRRSTCTCTYCLPSCMFCWGTQSFRLFIDSYQHFLISAKQNTTLAHSGSLWGLVQQLKEVRHSCDAHALSRTHSVRAYSVVSQYCWDINLMCLQCFCLL